MTLSQIQCFLVVAEKMSITEAANILYVTQPAVSHRISKLEQELDVELFYRDNSKIVLTPAGRKYMEFFSGFVDGLKRLSEETSDENILNEKVVIGCADGWDISDMFNRTKQLVTGEYPGISLKLECCSNDELISKLSNKGVDLVLALETIFMSVANMDVTPVARIRGAVIYSDHHPLANKENLSIADFRDYPVYVIVSQKNSFAASDIVQFCMRSGFTPKTEYVNSLSAALVKMRTEDGILIADQFLISGQNPMFRSFPIEMKRTISIGIKKNASKACEIVKETLLKVCGETLRTE